MPGLKIVLETVCLLSSSTRHPTSKQCKHSLETPVLSRAEAVLASRIVGSRCLYISEGGANAIIE